MLAKPWFIFSEVLHVLSLSNIYKSVWRKLISFCFNLLHFTSSKNQNKKCFKVQEPGLFIFFLIPFDQRTIKNLRPFATISKKIAQTKFQRKIINLVALGLFQTSIFNRKKTQFLVNKTFSFKIICEKFLNEIIKIKTKELACI